MPPLVPLPSPSRGMEAAYGEVRHRDGAVDDFTSPAIFIILISVPARLCWPTFTANCPTNRPRFSSHADRAIACDRTASLTSRRFLFCLPLPPAAPNAIRDRGWRSNNNNNDCKRARRRVMVCTGRITSKRNAKLSKNYVPWWTGSLFNLRSRRVP